MLDELLCLVLEFFGELIVELLLNPFLDLCRGVFGRPQGDAVLATFLLVVAGVVLGLLSILLWPARLLYPLVLPGLGVFVSAMATGTVMHGWGRLRESGGGVVTHLETFYGGAAFALAFSAVRLLGVS